MLNFPHHWSRRYRCDRDRRADARLPDAWLVAFNKSPAGACKACVLAGCAVETEQVREGREEVGGLVARKVRLGNGMEGSGRCPTGVGLQVDDCRMTH